MADILKKESVFERQEELAQLLTGVGTAIGALQLIVEGTVIKDIGAVKEGLSDLQNSFNYLKPQVQENNYFPE